jgi:hypothetical protein
MEKKREAIGDLLEKIASPIWLFFAIRERIGKLLKLLLPNPSHQLFFVMTLSIHRVICTVL